ncbi:hypothetical protein K474DRAFT_1707721 [Panus rudis PR-1116 ss-1]|nr:hypothetical protein K474DRAFT_1707721 [Panus rudis PR-1116 ss-1]
MDGKPTPTSNHTRSPNFIPVWVTDTPGPSHPACLGRGDYYRVSNNPANNRLRLGRGSPVRLILAVAPDPNNPYAPPLLLGPAGHLDKVISFSQYHVDMSFLYRSDANLPIIVRVPMDLCQRNPWREYICQFAMDCTTQGYGPAPLLRFRPRPSSGQWMRGQQGPPTALKRRALYIPNRESKARVGDL